MLQRLHRRSWSAFASMLAMAVPSVMAQDSTPPAPVPSAPPSAPSAPVTPPGPAAAPAQAPPSGGPVTPGGDAKKDEMAEDLTAAPKDVNIRRELKVMEEVYRRRLALNYLKNADKPARDAILKDLDPQSSAAITRLVDDVSSFTNLDYHYLEKIKNCENRLLHRLRKDEFQGIEDLLEAVKDKTYPNSAAYANLLNTVEMNFRFALRKNLIKDSEFAKDAAARLTNEQMRVNGTAGHDAIEIAKAMWKDAPPDQFPAYWFDPSSGPLSYEFGEVPDSPSYPTIDLNKTTKEELLAIPNLEEETADAILKYGQKSGFQGPEELRLVTGVPSYLVSPLMTITTASSIQKPKKWTVMVFLNAANNLEPFGIEDLNEMEKVGSTKDVNVVVELARYRGLEKRPRVNNGYFQNPFTEREQQFYFGLESPPGTSRYYVLKDDDKVRVQSVLKMTAPAIDAGRKENLSEFGKWAVENYPAENYCMVIWNHGAGWSGVSFDENSNHTLDLPEVREALEGVTASLKNGKKKIDVLDFDACLMATLEVGYELKDSVDYLVASQETEPGDGMPYDDYLGWLVTYPEAPAGAFAKAMVDNYVKSYAPKGSQTIGDFVSFGETKSALRLAKTADLKDSVENVARLLKARPNLLGEVSEEIVRDTRKFGRLVDIHDFCKRLSERAKDDAELKAACTKVIDQIGYPTDSDKLVNEVIIKRRSAGAVVWGYNNWQSPPRNLAPYVYKSKWAKTPLVGPDEKGNYVARITFPPMLADAKDPKGKPQLVTEINYRFEDDPEKRTVKDFANTFITTDFPADGPVVAEGHLVSNNRSRGVSLYFPAYLGFDKEYLKLKFAANSDWADLCELFPLKKLEKPAPIALLGIQHASKADRDVLGKIVVREEFRDKILKYDFAAPLAGDLKSFGLAYDCIRDPRPYGEDWTGMLKHWQDGVVILDNHLGGQNGGNPFSYVSSERSPPPSSGPESRAIMRHLKQGGRLLLSMPGIAAELWDTPLYRDTLGLEYGQRWDYGYGFKVSGCAALKDKPLELVTARKGEAITTFSGGPGVEPLCVLDGGAMIGAKIDRVDAETGKNVRAVVLGFYLTDVKGDDNRRALLKEALDFLTPKIETAPGSIGLTDSAAPPTSTPVEAAKATSGTKH